MKTVWKYTVGAVDEFTFDMPVGSEILSFDYRDSEFCVWALVDPKCKEIEHRYFRLAGTGHPIPTTHKLKFIGTCHYSPTRVFHLFEKDGR